MAEPSPLPADEIAEWFARHLPEGWFTGEVRVLVDRDEILVTGPLACPSTKGKAAGVKESVEQEQVGSFREETRDERIRIASRAEALFGRKVSWAVECGATQAVFTHLGVPVMTRLRIHERRTLDTLVAAGVARSRSEALSWCVRLVGEHEGDWIDELRAALEAVEQVKARRRG
jgi:hypothetical protein